MNNPYAPPTSRQANTPKRSVVSVVGIGIAILGILAILYGALAFWVFNGMYPNGGTSGRLPSMYVMGLGIVLTLVGLGMKGVGGKSTPQGSGAKKIPAIYGVAAIVLVLVVLFAIVANL